MDTRTGHRARTSFAALLLTGLLAASLAAHAVDPVPHAIAAATAAPSAAASAVTGAKGDHSRPDKKTDPGPLSTTPKGKPSDSHKAKPRTDRGISKDYVAPIAGDHDEDEQEVHNGESKNGTSTKQLLFHNNAAIQTSPRIYLVYWGSTWFTGGDPYGVANRLHYFYQGLGGSTYPNVLKQFSTATYKFTNPANQYQGWYQDKTAIPANPTKADVAAAAKRAALYFNDWSYNAQYIIAMPWGYVDTKSTQNSFCAWHDYTYVSGSNWVTFTSLPYIPYEDYLGRGCGKGKVNGTNGLLDGVTILASHEYAETVNDPGLNAWFDADGDENADKCSWTNLANRPLANGYSFPLQPYWSNEWRSTYGYGCYYS